MFKFKAMLIALFCTIFYLPVSLSLVKESVPFLIWSNQRAPIETPAVPVQPIPFLHLQGKYLKTFNPDNILLVFLQDTLSVEDLSSHEREFKNVKNYMEAGHSLYLPAVEVSDSLSHSFSANGYNIITLEPGSSVGELKLEKDTKNLVLVKLPSTITNPSRQKALQKSNEVIENVISKIGEMANFTVIFTGSEPSVKSENELDHGRITRSLQQFIGLPSNDTSFHHTKCVILYLRDDIEIKKGNMSSYTLFNNRSLNINKDDCQNESTSIIIYYADVGGHNKVSVTFNFSRTIGRWTLDHVRLSEDGKYTILNPMWNMEHVPLKKSYSCAKRLVLRTNNTDLLNSEDYLMIIDGLQFEPFTNGSYAFSDAWDCVGFFTIPIWMGLFAAIILATILAIGMFMLSEIKTMDRFDDPKGKHIMVTAASD